MFNNLQPKNILTYDDVVPMPAGENNEPIVDVCSFDAGILAQYDKLDMLDYTGDAIYTRASLAQKLAAVNAALKPAGLALKVVYGYRHPQVQEKYFLTRRSELATQNPGSDDHSLDRMTHAFVAVPDVAGHPAGAAVDLTIINSQGDEIDMGTPIADYSDPEKIITYSKQLTATQVENRALLHQLMTDQGFAPFHGEWWHFSYGDREWAAFYGKKKALYSTIEFRP